MKQPTEPELLLVTVAASRTAGTVTLTLTGDIDALAGPRLLKPVDSCLGDGAARLILDLHQVGFVDVAGLRVLLRAHRLSAQRAVRLTVRRPAPHVAWLMQVTGTATMLLGDGSGDDRHRIALVSTRSGGHPHRWPRPDP